MIAPVELYSEEHRSAVDARHQHRVARMVASFILSWVATSLYARAVPHDVVIETYVALYVASGLIGSVSLWRIFEKAGLPGWSAAVPFYNVAMLYRLVGRRPRHSAFLLIPVLNVYLYIRLMNEVARAFGGDRIFTLALVVSPFIAFPMMAFGRAVYRPPAPSA
jgi:hypothetical protein